MIARLRHLGHDQQGTTTVEFTIVALLFLLLTFGLVEFGNMFWQFNSAAKAAQLGARLAAVSNPVWGELVNLEYTGTPGSAWEIDYTVTCDGDSGDCDGTYSGRLRRRPRWNASCSGAARPRLLATRNAIRPASMPTKPACATGSAASPRRTSS